MGTITDFVKKQVYQTNAINSQVSLIENIIDFSKLNVAASDVVQVAKIPAGAIVRDVIVTVLTAEGATCTADVGDTGDADGWIDDANLNAVGAKLSLPAIDYKVAGGKAYTANGTINLTMAHNASTAKLAVIVEVIYPDNRYTA